MPGQTEVFPETAEEKRSRVLEQVRDKLVEDFDKAEKSVDTAVSKMHAIKELLEDVEAVILGLKAQSRGVDPDTGEVGA